MKTRRYYLQYKNLLAFCLLFACLTNSPTVTAKDPACWLTSGASSASFGALSSFAIASGLQQTSAQPSAGIRCQGPLLALLALTDRLTATITSSNNGYLKTAAGDAVSYQMYADPAHQEALYLNTPYNYYNSYILGLLGLIGGEADIPMYFTIQAAHAGNLAAGHYTDTLQIHWDWSICYGIGILGICLGLSEGSLDSTVTVELDILPDCIISAPDLHFGQAPLVSAFNPVSQNILVRCTKNQAYNVGINDGLHAANGQRRMASGGNYLAYDVYKGASGLLRWGRLATERRHSSDADSQAGNYDGLTAQSFNYRGIIQSNQSTPPPGLYTDTLIVDVDF